MIRFPNVLRNAFVALALLVFAERFACAYLDAGSGSMLIQLLLGGTAGLLMAIKLFWRKIRERLAKLWNRRERKS